MAFRLLGKKRKDLLIASGIILVVSALFPSDTYAWSSVYETRTLGGTHHNLCRLAYQQLQKDPAFRGIPFPSLQAIIDQGAVSAGALGSGQGLTTLRVQHIPCITITRPSTGGGRPR